MDNITCTLQVLNLQKKKSNVDFKREEINKYSVYVKPGISRSQQLEELSNSKVVDNLFNKPKNRTVPIGDVFEAQYNEKKGSNIQ